MIIHPPDPRIVMSINRLVSFHSEIALFHNFIVNLQNWLCGVLQYTSAQIFDFLELIKNCLFLNWKLIRVSVYSCSQNMFRFNGYLYLNIPVLVIPAKAGIQSHLGWINVVGKALDSGFHRSDDFL